MEITRSSTDGATAKGPAEWFTGDVYIDSVAAPSHRPACRGTLSTSCRAPAPPGTDIRSDRACSSSRGSACVNAAAVPSR